MKNLFLALLCLPLTSLAQVKTPLVAEGTSPSLYITHTTGPKENMYSIGRIYNISPRVIAPFNNIVLEDGLKIGQVVRVPLTELNFSQDGNAMAGEVLVPVHHKVQPKETLFTISTNANKVPVERLKQWNKLTGDAVSQGKNLIIGYLKINPELSPLASLATKVTPSAPPAETVITTQPPQPPVKQEVKPEPKKEDVKVEVETKQPEVKKAEVPAPANSKDFKGGAFKSLYASKGKTETGTAGMFKSTSGWNDGKYYCLHNTAQAGTIIKITNNANGKVVYAKVLDIIPDIRQNEGVIIRLSNAAADELGAGIENFNCTLNY